MAWKTILSLAGTSLNPPEAQGVRDVPLQDTTLVTWLSEVDGAHVPRLAPRLQTYSRLAQGNLSWRLPRESWRGSSTRYFASRERVGPGGGGPSR